MYPSDIGCGQRDNQAGNFCGDAIVVNRAAKIFRGHVHAHMFSRLHGDARRRLICPATIHGVVCEMKRVRCGTGQRSFAGEHRLAKISRASIGWFRKHRLFRLKSVDPFAISATACGCWLRRKNNGREQQNKNAEYFYTHAQPPIGRPKPTSRDRLLVAREFRNRD